MNYTYSGPLEKLASDLVKKLNISTSDPAIKDALDVLRCYFKPKEEGTADPFSSGLPDDIRESVAISNIKSVGEQPSMLSNLSFSNLITNDNLSQQNAISNQQAMNQLAITVAAKATNRISDPDPRDAISINELDTGNDLAAQLAELRAATNG
jgi:hypothetical protein